jgi:HK97 family phage major capsid protein
VSLTAQDVGGWSLERVREEITRRMNDVQSLRDKNGGTIVGMVGDDAINIQEHLNTLNDVLAPRRDELVAQKKGDVEFQRMVDFVKEPADGNGHPGHGRPGAARQEPRDIGHLFSNSDAFKAFKAQGTLDRAVTVPMDSLWPGYQGIGEMPNLRPQATLFDSSGYPIQPQFLPTPIETLYQANSIGPLFAQGTTTLPVVRYVTETVTATGAAETAEGIGKPEAQISFASTDEPIRKIAVLLPMTDESLDDIPLLRAYINSRLQLFVRMREDGQLLNGNGTAPNLKGILLRSGINTATSYSIGGANPDQALVEAVFHAAMRVRDAFLEPDAAVMKPATWEIARLAKDGNRNYLLGPAAGDAATRLWGLNVVLNANMPAQVAANKDVLVGAFAASAMLIRRGGLDLALSDSHSTFFAENKVMLRAEERVGLAVWRPAGFAAVTSAA